MDVCYEAGRWISDTRRQVTQGKANSDKYTTTGTTQAKVGLAPCSYRLVPCRQAQAPALLDWYPELWPPHLVSITDIQYHYKVVSGTTV